MQLYKSVIDKKLSAYRWVVNGTQGFRGRRTIRMPGTWANYSSITLPGPLTDLTAMGTKGWAKFKPGKPVAGPAVFLAELRQLPTVPLRLMARAKTFRDLAQGSGKEYLNYEFGWKPFVRDVISFITAQENVAKNLDYLVRNNGRWVRRKGEVSVTNSVDVTVGHAEAYLWPTLSTWLYWNTLTPPKGNLTTTVKTRYWFSGKFRWWIPDLKSVEGLDRVKRHLYGLDITPHTLWQIMPWSWLVDWFGSVGDIIDNLTNNIDGLVAQYAYIMGNRETEYLYECTERLFDGSYQTASGALRYSVKMRASASPYGFGLLSSDLTDRQVAILTALGLSQRW